MDPSPTLAIAFVAGVVSFLSPCVLPLVPGYVGLVSGMSLEQLTEPGPKALSRTFLKSLLFVVGFSIVFTVLGAFASGLASPLAPSMPWLRKIAGAVVVLFGLHTMRVLPVRLLYRQKSLDLAKAPAGWFAPLLMGMAFAFGWTPCVGPILASVLALALTEASILHGMELLFVYSLGIGVPFILTSLGVRGLLQFLRKYRRVARAVEFGAGILLIVMGVLIFTNNLAALAAPFPFLNRFAR